MNKLAFITGATSGIGLATAKALAENSFDLALAARNEEKLYACLLYTSPSPRD